MLDFGDDIFTLGKKKKQILIIDLIDLIESKGTSLAFLPSEKVHELNSKRCTLINIIYLK